jgi:hypothetical protein
MKLTILSILSAAFGSIASDTYHVLSSFSLQKIALTVAIVSGILSIVKTTKDLKKNGKES